MQIKKRDMKKTNWSRCLEKTFTSNQVIINNEEATVGLIMIQKVVEPLIINYEFGKKMIANDNYKWLQIAIKNQNFWITAMYDNKNNLIQIYIDITRQNCFEDVLNPYFYDLFLDIVVLPDQNFYILDENELNQALNEKAITQKEYQLANTIKDKLILYLKDNCDKLINFCNLNFSKLLNKM